MILTSQGVNNLILCGITTRAPRPRRGGGRREESPPIATAPPPHRPPQGGDVYAMRLPSGIPSDMDDAAFHPSSDMTCAGHHGTIPVVVRKAKYFLVEMHASSGRWWGLFGTQ